MRYRTTHFLAFAFHFLVLHDCLYTGTGTHTDMLPGVPGDAEYDIRSYGEKLRENKKVVTDAYIEVDLSNPLRALFLGMAFQETTLMTAEQRDDTKDGRLDGSANWSLWNLNEDMLLRLGYDDDFQKLNDPVNVSTVLMLMRRGVDRWGVPKFLAFVRGGKTGFYDTRYFSVYDFQNAIATHLKVISRDILLFGDDRRIEIKVERV